MGIAVGVPDRVLGRVRGWGRRPDGVVDAVAEPPDELRVKCEVCGHGMELVDQPATQPLQPVHRWQCLCGNWKATYDRSDEGEV